MRLHLFTASYPYGTKETFLESELPILSANFDEVLIYPFNTTRDVARSIPENAQIVHWKGTDSSSKGIVLDAFQMVFEDLVQGRQAMSNLRYNFAYAKHILGSTQKLNTFWEGQDLSNAVFYSYWFDEWATILSLLTNKSVIHGYVTRTHRFDLFDECNPSGFIPFRSLQFYHARQVYSVSKAGTDYLKDRFPRSASRITCAYLGTDDHGIAKGTEPGQPFHLVSCSNVIPFKRVSLIADALAGLKGIEWTHIGHGEEFENLQSHCAKIQSQNPDLKINLVGAKPHDEVMKFYENNPVSGFINVSESEGLPVSIMEAMSFGVPVVATAVGGNAEIVNDETGILLPANPTAEEVSKAISNLFERFSESKAREQVRARWKAQFSADVNFQQFAQELRSYAQ